MLISSLRCPKLKPGASPMQLTSTERGPDHHGWRRWRSDRPNGTVDGGGVPKSVPPGGPDIAREPEFETPVLADHQQMELEIHVICRNTLEL